MTSMTHAGRTSGNAEGVETWADDLCGAIAEAYRLAAEDPQRNPILHLAHRFSSDLEAGSVTLDDCEALVRHLLARAARTRAVRLAGYVGLETPENEALALVELVRRTAEGPFEDFATLWGREAVGVVLTGHPTFAVPPETRRAIAEMAGAHGAGGRNGNADNIDQRIASGPHRLPRPPRLEEELTQAHAAAEELRAALRELRRTVLDIARERYPEAWRSLVPCFMTVACWVGYDLDGRTDIDWTTSLRIRLEEKKSQIEKYIGQLEPLLSHAGRDAATVAALDEIRTTLRDGLAALDAPLALFAEDPSRPGALARAANALTEAGPGKLVSLKSLRARLDGLIAATPDDDLALDLACLRAEMAEAGLGTVQPHLRVNAVQIHNAVRGLIGMDGEPETPGLKRQLLARLSELLSETDGRRINFATVAAEPTTAKRQMMLLAQIVKHIDADRPIRFLIAECESSFTILAALYIARLLGIEERVDLSPLFETPAALEHAPGLIEELLSNHHFRDYVNRRGRLCIETGFSDAGRFLGQPSAALAIERLHVKLARILERHDLAGIEVVMFDTHGESIGRGGHPKSLAERFDYILSPTSRRAFHRAGTRLKHEISFQGGDGFIYFDHPRLARAALRELVRHTLAAPPTDQEETDRLYREIDRSLGFFFRAKNFHEEAIENPEYEALLNLFEDNLLTFAGSRHGKRQHEGASHTERRSPREIRAIPHNAILQQLGYMANSVGGIGRALAADVAGLAALHERSPRLQLILASVVHARRLSSLHVLASYAQVFNPDYWQARAYADPEAAPRDRFRRLAAMVARKDSYPLVSRMIQRLRDDAIDLRDALQRIGIHIGGPRDDQRLALDLLHVLRVALLMRLLIGVMRVPRFADRGDLSLETFQKAALCFDIPRLLAGLNDTFPRKPAVDDAQDFAEKADYRDRGHEGYDELHSDLFEPLARTYGLVLDISAAVSHHAGAHG